MAIGRFRLVQIYSNLNDKPSVTTWNPSAPEAPGLNSAHKILGVTMTSSEYEEPVAVMKRGYLRDVLEQNSETWAVGDVLWAKDGGSITKTRPTAPDPFILVGTVFDGPDGSDKFAIDVDVRVLPSIMELSNVKVETPVDLDVMIYNASNTYYEPRRLVHGTDISALGSAGDPSNDDHPQYQQETDFIHPFLFSGGS
jgi:hypothetical protein